jgi:diadenosine tetraphosphatase ApaH/serine/threonine PP2A family protein phosphatase
MLADIHANIEALEAVLQDATSRQFDTIVFLGDAVGYGPDPGAVIDKLETINARCILGNHEAMMLGLPNAEVLDGPAGQAIRWQRQQLSVRQLEILRKWPERRKYSGVSSPDTAPVNTNEGIPAEFFMVHGSPKNLFDYVDNLANARAAFTDWAGRLAFVGHTHKPGVYATINGPTGEWTRWQGMEDAHNRLPMPPKARWIANPGSVGQPRDGNPDASYGIYDFARGMFEVHRVKYDLETTQQKIRAAGLPDMLAARLEVGK